MRTLEIGIFSVYSREKTAFYSPARNLEKEDKKAFFVWRHEERKKSKEQT